VNLIFSGPRMDKGSLRPLVRVEKFFIRNLTLTVAILAGQIRKKSDE
jgi:hypothetical protein